ncbi:phosphotransferase family protein [Actinophytocola sp.]|uniref:phosphotransferase family protein n=1 Tax=Actinophytocola sp. TaxID=1872138 RepID=UPI002EDAD117
MTDARVRAALDVLGEGEDDGDGWQLTQLAGGWSRHTYRLSSADRSYVVRVKPPGSLLDTDLVTEYRTYVELRNAKVPVPAAYGVDASEDNSFGGPFFVMDWVRGEAPVVWRGRDRAALEANWRDSRGLGTDLVETLAAIHGAPAAAFDFLGPPRPFADVVGHWRETYERQRLLRDPVVEEAFAWVLSREPDPAEPGLVHGDYRIGNTMVHDERIAAVVDWELSYVGDRRFDLGYAALDYHAGKFVAPGSPLLCAVADREWFLAEYERLTGTTVDREVVRTYSALGALVLIAILLTGIRMYADGATTDVRMAWNRYAVPGLRQDLVRLMGW